jgi:hypothetical protein
MGRGKLEEKGRKKIMPIVYVGTVGSDRISYVVRTIQEAGCSGVFLAGKDVYHNKTKANIYQELKKKYPNFFIGLSFNQKTTRRKYFFDKCPDHVEGVLLREMVGYEDDFMITKISRDVYCGDKCLFLGCIALIEQIGMGEAMLRKTVLSASQVVDIVCLNSMIVEASRLRAVMVDAPGIKLGILIDRFDDFIPDQYDFLDYFLPVLPIKEIPHLRVILKSLCQQIRK